MLLTWGDRGGEVWNVKFRPVECGRRKRKNRLGIGGGRESYKKGGT